MRFCYGALLALAACGGDEAPPIAQLTLAERYDVAGVARLFPDGLNYVGHRSFHFRLEALRSSGGRAVGQGMGSGAAVALSGTFDPAMGELVLGPADGILTATTTERIVSLGGRAEDSLPKDGIAQELVGFVNSNFGELLSEGRFVATAEYEERPPAPDLSKLHLTPAGLGKFLLSGEAGAVSNSAGVEVLRHQVDRGPPLQVAFQARPDGSVNQELDALTGEILVILTRAAGRPSAPVLLPVP